MKFQNWKGNFLGRRKCLCPDVGCSHTVTQSHIHESHPVVTLNISAFYVRKSYFNKVLGRKEERKRGRNRWMKRLTQRVIKKENLL